MKSDQMRRAKPNACPISNFPTTGPDSNYQAVLTRNRMPVCEEFRAILLN